MISTDSPSGNVRTLFRTPEFNEFYNSLPDKVQLKFLYVMNVIATVYDISTKFVKHLDKTDLYEMRISVGNNEFRTVLFAIDHKNLIEAKNILLLNGFQKKDTKDYRKQIAIAQSILNKLEL
jgi:phage-related protein